jgi:hypothetical protein
MPTALMEMPMATDKPKTLSVKLELDVIESARIVTAYRGETMTELLSRILRPVLAKMEQDESAKRHKRPVRKGKTVEGEE